MPKPLHCSAPKRHEIKVQGKVARRRFCTKTCLSVQLLPLTVARSQFAMLKMRVAEPKLRYFSVLARSIRFLPSVIIRQRGRSGFGQSKISTSAEARAVHDDMSTITMLIRRHLAAATDAIKAFHVNCMCSSSSGSSWPVSATTNVRLIRQIHLLSCDVHCDTSA